MTSAATPHNKKQINACGVVCKRVISAAVAVSLVGQTVPALAQVPPATIAEQSQAQVQVQAQAQAPAAETTALQASITVSVTPLEGTSTVPIIAVSSPLTTTTLVVAPLVAAPRMLPVVYSYTGADQSTTKAIMDDLRVVHLSAMQKNLAAQIALNIGMLFLGGGVGFSGVSKESFAGALPDDVKDVSRLKNPAMVQLVQEVQRQSSDWLGSSAKTSELKFSRPLVVSSAAWRLIYNSHSPDDKTYQLRFDADVYKIRDKKSFFSNPSSTGKRCSYVSNPRQIGEWKVNDYQAVVDLMPIVVTQCAKEFTAQLPDLLDLK